MERSGAAMANRAGSAQRPNGGQQGKICQFKLVLLGESAVGKSSLVLRFVKGQFHEFQESTIGGERMLGCHSVGGDGSTSLGSDYKYSTV